MVPCDLGYNTQQLPCEKLLTTMQGGNLTVYLQKVIEHKTLRHPNERQCHALGCTSPCQEAEELKKTKAVPWSVPPQAAAIQYWVRAGTRCQAMKHLRALHMDDGCFALFIEK